MQNSFLIDTNWQRSKHLSQRTELVYQKSQIGIVFGCDNNKVQKALKIQKFLQNIWK